MNDLIHIAVDGLISEEVVAVHSVLLSVAMGAILCLLAIRIGPGELDKSDTACSRQCQSSTAGLVVEDY